eukprot:16427684-Heterocapsa_arctica.AAC.1
MLRRAGFWLASQRPDLRRWAEAGLPISSNGRKGPPAPQAQSGTGCQRGKDQDAPESHGYGDGISSERGRAGGVGHPPGRPPNGPGRGPTGASPRARGASGAAALDARSSSAAEAMGGPALRRSPAAIGCVPAAGDAGLTRPSHRVPAGQAAGHGSGTEPGGPRTPRGRGFGSEPTTAASATARRSGPRPRESKPSGGQRPRATGSGPREALPPAQRHAQVSPRGTAGREPGPAWAHLRQLPDRHRLHQRRRKREALPERAELRVGPQASRLRGRAPDLAPQQGA